MVGLRAIFFAATALSSTVLASFEPLAADDLFGRGAAPNFEPLSPTTTRRGAIPGAHLPKVHGAIAARGGASGANSAYIAGHLSKAIEAIKPVHSGVKDKCSSIKGGSHSKNPVGIVSSLQPELAHCKKIVNDCGGGIGGWPHPHPHPHPSGKPGPGPGPGGCGGLLAELIQLIEELIWEITQIAKEVPILANLLEGYVQALDEELAQILSGAEAAVPGVQSYVTSLVSSLTTALKDSGFSSLLGQLGH